MVRNIDDAFFVCDLGNVVKKWKRFYEILSKVELFYGLYVSFLVMNHVLLDSDY